MTKAQQRALMCCDGDGLTRTGKIVYGIRADVLQRLEDSALITYRPYAREPRWKLTRYGRAALRRLAQ